MTKIIKNNYTLFYAVVDGRVIGWCDIYPRPEEFYSHVGDLGMGIIKGYRGKGIGTKLIKKAIAHAKNNGIERIELEVNESNKIAKHLYRKMGFEIEGIKKKGKKFDNEYEDIIMMALV